MNNIARFTIALVCAASAFANEAPNEKSLRNGEHDFDFEVGHWTTHVKRLQRPLTGSQTWLEYDGTTEVRNVLNGKGVLVELTMDGAAGHFEGLSLRLYNPESHQWSLNFANAAGGMLTTPTIGEFKAGRGEFYDQETLNGCEVSSKFRSS